MKGKQSDYSCCPVNDFGSGKFVVKINGFKTKNKINNYLKCYKIIR